VHLLRRFSGIGKEDLKERITAPLVSLEKRDLAGGEMTSSLTIHYDMDMTKILPFGLGRKWKTGQTKSKGRKR